jgi:hypothetical protein
MKITKFSLPILFIAVGLLVTVAAEKAVHFNGIWVLDPTNVNVHQTSPEIRPLSIESSGGVSISDTDSHTPQVSLGNYVRELMKLTSLQIEQTDTEIRMTRRFSGNGPGRTIIQKFKLDGSQCLNVSSNGQGEFQSRSNWKNNKFITFGSQIIYDETFRIESYVKEEYSMSKNGKKLTIKTIATGPNGVITIKQVFHRQDS